MASTTMSSTAGDFVKYEAPYAYSREDVTVAAGNTLTAGTVVGRITASGKIKAFDPAAVDGSENAIGVLIADVDASAADAPGVIIARHALVADPVWAGSPTQAQKDAAIAALKALGIVARTTV